MQRKLGIMMPLRDILENQDGATAIEYGLIAAVIVVTAITAMVTMGNSLSDPAPGFNQQEQRVGQQTLSHPPRQDEQE